MSLVRTVARRVRGGVKRRARRALETLGVLPVEPPAAPVPAPTQAPPGPAAPTPAAAPAPSAPRESLPAADATVSTGVGSPGEASAPAAGLQREQVEELLEDMVRPALQSDGGDITLVRVEPEGDVYVELVGACSSCPSATITMRQGIERLMEAELPGFRSLVEVNGMGMEPESGAMA